MSMLVSTKGRYALRMMVDIARQDSAGNISLREIGERQGISIKYLEQLARLLCAADLLQGNRGQGGGYMLKRPAVGITAGEILRAVEGSTAPVACMTEENIGLCPRQTNCEAAGFWQGLDNTINTYINGYTLQDLVNESAGCTAAPGPCLSTPYRQASSSSGR